MGSHVDVGLEVCVIFMFCCVWWGFYLVGMYRCGLVFLVIFDFGVFFQLLRKYLFNGQFLLVFDDVQVYGFLVDVYIELGEQEQVEVVVQWMLDLCLGNVFVFIWGVYLCELYGYMEVVIEFFQRVYQ